MSIELAGVADDYFANLTIQTTMPLPNTREGVLHFFEAAQKEFPSMCAFYQRESGEFLLEGDRDSGSYQWIEIAERRLTAGSFNPPDIDRAYKLHDWFVERGEYILGVSPLDMESIDVLLGFNLDYNGNRDAIVYQALLGGSHLGAMAAEQGRAVEFEPSMTFALDEDCCLQARLSMETRCGSYQVRTGQYDEEPISVYFAVRRYPHPGRLLRVKESLIRQREVCEDLTIRIVIPRVIEPIVAAIAAGE